MYLNFYSPLNFLSGPCPTKRQPFFCKTAEVADTNKLFQPSQTTPFSASRRAIRSTSRKTRGEGPSSVRWCPATWTKGSTPRCRVWTKGWTGACATRLSAAMSTLTSTSAKTAKRRRRHVRRHGDRGGRTLWRWEFTRAERVSCMAARKQPSSPSPPPNQSPTASGTASRPPARHRVVSSAATQIFALRYALQFRCRWEHSDGRTDAGGWIVAQRDPDVEIPHPAHATASKWEPNWKCPASTISWIPT